MPNANRFQSGPSLLISIGVLLLALLVSPFGCGSILALQTAPGPRCFSWLISSLNFAAIFFLFGGLALSGAAPVVTLLCILDRRKHRWAGLSVAVWVLVWVSWSTRPMLEAQRMNRIRRVPQRSASLIAAIEAYKIDHDVYPDDLNQLVPDYLPAVPGTGMMGYPEFIYNRAKGQSRFSRYELRVNTPQLIVNWDSFFYWPEQNYPAQYGGAVERVGDWANLHE